MRKLLLFLSALLCVAADTPRIEIRGRNNGTGSNLPSDPTISWVKLNEGSGTSAAALAGPNFTTDADWSALTQASASCLSFVAANGDSAQTVSSITYSVNVITVTFWVNAVNWGTTSTRTNLVESSADVDGSGGFNIYTADNVIYCYYYDGNLGGVFTGHITPPSTNAWHHLAFVIDNQTGTPAAYVDGSVVSISTDFTNWATAGTFPSGVLFLGSRNDTSAFFNGKMDDFRIYNSGLSAANIAAIYAANAQ